MPTAVIYTRISSDPEGERAGVRRQHDDCVELAKQKEWTVVGAFEDNDRSAYTGKRRTGWDGIRDRIAAGGVDHLVAWANDRLTRHPRELEDLIDLLEKHGTDVVTVTSGDYDLATPEGRALARIVGAIARQESERKSVRQRRKNEADAAAGKRTGGRRAFGYQTDGVTIHQSEAEVLREIATRVIAGESLRSLAIDLNDRNIRTAGGNRWQSARIRDVLKNPRYGGFRTHRGEIVAEANWPPIFDRETHERLQLILNDPNRRTSPGRERRYLFTSGIAVCANCGHRMIARPVRGKRRYGCPASRTTPEACGRVYVAANDFEKHVVEQLLNALEDPRVLEGLARAESDVDVAANLEELRLIEVRKGDLAAAFADGEIDRQQLATATERLNSLADDLRAQLDSSHAQATDLSGIDDIRAVWHEQSLEWQHRPAEAVFDRIVVASAVPGRNTFDPHRIRIEFRVD